VTETLPALLELKQQGTIRAVGITGYPLDIFSYILDRYVQGWAMLHCTTGGI